MNQAIDRRTVFIDGILIKEEAAEAFAKTELVEVESLLSQIEAERRYDSIKTGHYISENFGFFKKLRLKLLDLSAKLLCTLVCQFLPGGLASCLAVCRR